MEKGIHQETNLEKLGNIIENLPPPLKCFKDLQNKNAPIFEMMKEYGSKWCPLSVIGNFLNYCGNHILHYMQEHCQPKDGKYQMFYPQHEVVSVTMLNDGHILTTSISDGKYVQFKSKYIVMSQGAK